MLNRAKLIAAIDALAPAMFEDWSEQLDWLRAIASHIAQDIAFTRLAQQSSTLPHWDAVFDQAVPIEPATRPYSAYATDGSQVYPDRHQGSSCFLINIGFAQLTYGAIKSQAFFESTPYLFSPAQGSRPPRISSTEMVNQHRHELEIAAAVRYGTAIRASSGDIDVGYFFDGPLNAWYLEGQESCQGTRSLTAVHYEALQQLYQHGIPCAGYVSAPRTTDLMSVVKAFTTYHGAAEPWCKAPSFKHMVDTTLMALLLPVQTRSVPFKCPPLASANPPEHLQSYFFYLNAEQELARVEVPAWIATDSTLLAMVSTILADQVNKGRGYPVVLAEAHEQAVVKGPDRNLFYYMLARASISRKKEWTLSQKNRKKWGLPI